MGIRSLLEGVKGVQWLIAPETYRPMDVDLELRSKGVYRFPLSSDALVVVPFGFPQIVTIDGGRYDFFDAEEVIAEAQESVLGTKDIRFPDASQLYLGWAAIRLAGSRNIIEEESKRWKLLGEYHLDSVKEKNDIGNRLRTYGVSVHQHLERIAGREVRSHERATVGAIATSTSYAPQEYNHLLSVD